MPVTNNTDNMSDEAEQKMKLPKEIVDKFSGQSREVRARTD